MNKFKPGWPECISRVYLATLAATMLGVFGCSSASGREAMKGHRHA